MREAPHLGTCPRPVPTSLISHARSQRTTMAKPELTLESMQSTIESLEDNVTKLHEALEKKGVNSRGTKDIFGRVFSMPVWLFSPTQNTSPSKPTGNDGDYLTLCRPSTCRLTRSTRRPSSSSSTTATRTRAPSTSRGGASSPPSSRCSPVRSRPLPHAPAATLERASLLVAEGCKCLRVPTCYDVPHRSCAADGVHEEGDLPQPEQE